VDVFDIFRWILIVVISTTVPFPVTIPLAALAYKVQRGPRRIRMEPTAFWVRSAFVAFGLAAGSLVVLAVDYYLVAEMDIPGGIVHLVFLLLFVPAGVFYIFWMYAFDEIYEALSVMLIFVGIPGFVFLLFMALNIDWPIWLAKRWLLPTA